MLGDMEHFSCYNQWWSIWSKLQCGTVVSSWICSHSKGLNQSVTTGSMSLSSHN